MFSRPEPDEIALIFTPLDGSAELRGSLWQILSADERERADRFHFEKHRNRFVAARGLLRTILAASTGMQPEKIQFAYGSQGKPALAYREDISFNLSTSGDSALYAIGSGQQLGVDLEQIRALDDMEQIAERYFCHAEYRELLAIPQAARPQAFYNCWTRKEAFVKALGEGLSHPLDRFHVTLQPGLPAEFVSIDGCTGSETDWALHDVAPSIDYAAALAVRNKTCGLQLRRFETAQACARF
jgi:4'-phosphopantetheinyl transferase